MDIAKILKLFVAVVFCMVISFPAYAAIAYHVTTDGTSGSNGLTWDTPMSIKMALGAAAACDEIWVTKDIFWSDTDANKSNIYAGSGSTLNIKNSVMADSDISGGGSINSKNIYKEAPKLDEHRKNDRVYAYIPNGTSALGNGLLSGVHDIGGVTVTVPEKDQLGKSRGEQVGIGSYQNYAVLVRTTPAVPVPSRPYSSGGGYSTGWAAIVLLPLCPLALILIIRNRDAEG